MSFVSGLFLVIITILCKRQSKKPLATISLTESSTVPPLGAYIVAGCGADLFVNICLTILG
jgi:hypothetical protein